MPGMGFKKQFGIYNRNESPKGLTSILRRCCGKWIAIGKAPMLSVLLFTGRKDRQRIFPETSPENFQPQVQNVSARREKERTLK